ncbi:MAG: hypothetical protein ACE15F_08300 [bacterium]
MCPEKAPFTHKILLQKNSHLPAVYDVILKHLDSIRNFPVCECHLILYPYSRTVCAHHMRFYPYEEYVKDISSRQRSAYYKISDRFDNSFGLLLGVLLIVLFAIFKPVELYSLEAFVAVFGIYMVGRDLWKDIEKILIGISRNWKIRYMRSYYQYQIDKSTSLSHYSYFAKKQRYGIAPLLPEKIDFLEQSNSQTVRLYFLTRDFTPDHEDSAHILSIHIDPSRLEDLEKGGYMFGVKFALSRSFGGFVSSCEYFQSLSHGQKGALNDNGKWLPDTVYFRKTYSFGRLKYFSRQGCLPGTSLFYSAG